MLHKPSRIRYAGPALVALCGLALSACAVNLPGGAGAVLLAIILAVLVFRPPCDREAQAAAGDNNIIPDDKGAPADAAGKKDSAKKDRGPDRGDLKATPCLAPCLSTAACLCTCELSGPERAPGPAAEPAGTGDVDLERDRHQAALRLGRQLPEELRRRLNSREG